MEGLCPKLHRRLDIHLKNSKANPFWKKPLPRLNHRALRSLNSSCESKIMIQHTRSQDTNDNNTSRHLTTANIRTIKFLKMRHVAQSDLQLTTYPYLHSAWITGTRHYSPLFSFIYVFLMLDIKFRAFAY